MQSSLFYNNITVLLLPFLLHACCRFCCIVVAVLTVSFLADFTAFVLSDYSFLCEDGKWSLAPAYDITYSPEGTRGEHATSVKYSGNPSLEDIISAGTGIRISRKRCIEIIEEIESVCKSELDVEDSQPEMMAYFLTSLVLLAF